MSFDSRAVPACKYRCPVCFEGFGKGKWTQCVLHLRTTGHLDMNRLTEQQAQAHCSRASMPGLAHNSIQNGKESHTSLRLRTRVSTPVESQPVLASALSIDNDDANSEEDNVMAIASVGNALARSNSGPLRGVTTLGLLVGPRPPNASVSRTSQEVCRASDFRMIEQFPPVCVPHGFDVIGASRSTIQRIMRESNAHIAVIIGESGLQTAVATAGSTSARCRARALLQEQCLPGAVQTPNLESVEDIADMGNVPLETCTAIEDPFQISLVRNSTEHRQCTHMCVHPATIAPALTSDSHFVSQPVTEHLLDEFQQRAIHCIDYGESVLVVAPTSAGKTLVAERACACALKAKRRAIYTSPIKALSNQKFLDFTKKFGEDVGLMTGDVVIKSDAAIVVMTAEVLLSMIYRLSEDPEALDMVQCVIFDEAQYLGDVERGHVWEESLILVPEHMQLVLLSAAIPNGSEVTEWLARVRHQTFHLIQSDRRPVPQIHSVFRVKEDGIADLVTVFRRGQFLHHQLAEVLQPLREQQAEKKRKWSRTLPASKRRKTDATPISMATSAGQRGGDQLDFALHVEHLLGLLVSRKRLPMMGFCFTRQQCEEIALALAGAKEIDLTTAEEKSLIIDMYKQGLAKLEPEDRALRQLQNSFLLLRRGFGVHHSGILPFMRELIELLFIRRLVKCVFATETFAVGINMPAKQVVFCGLSKFPGQQKRVLNTSEFQQMAGRAGRRGIDKSGTVTVMITRSQEMGVDMEKLLHDLYVGPHSTVGSHLYVRWATLLHCLRMGRAHLEMVFAQSLCRMGELKPSTRSGAKQVVDGRQYQRKAMIRILRELDYIDADGFQLLKGRVAARFHVPVEPLVLTEFFVTYRGLDGLTAPQTFAVCSCFVAEGCPLLTSIKDPAVESAVDRVKMAAKSFAGKLHHQGLICVNGAPCSKGLPCDGTAFVDARINTGLVGSVLCWVAGTPFPTAVLESNIEVGGEGLVVRGLRRLDELIREVHAVLRDQLVLPEAAQALRELRAKSRRGIVVAPSLYLGEAEDKAGDELEPEIEASLPEVSVGAIVELSPLKIGFTHNSCSAYCRDGNGILENAKRLLSGNLQVSKIPMIPVYWHRRRFYTLANRRLAAFRLVALARADAPGFRIRVRNVSWDEAREWGWTSKFTTGFNAGRRIRIGGTNLFVGQTRESSSFGQSLWELAVPELA